MCIKTQIYRKMKIKWFNIVVISLLLAQSIPAITLEDVYRDTIINDVTLSVPSDYADIEEALLFLDDKRIARNVTVTIQVADGTYNDCPTIVLDHPYGSRIEIIGNTSSPGSVVLNFVANHGIEASRGNTIGKIDGFTIAGDLTDYYHGVWARDNASIILGPNMIVQGFWCGILARRNGTVLAEGITVRNCTETGLNCGDATIFANGALVENNARGLYSFRTGFIQVDNATIRNNTYYAITVEAISLVQAKSATISGSIIVDPKGAFLQ